MRLVCLALFDPCGEDCLSVFDCFLCSGRNTPTNVLALFPDVAELRRREVDFLGFVADGDGVTACEGEGDGSTVDRVVRDGGSCEHVGERLCCLVVCVGVHGVGVGVHGFPLVSFVVGFCSGS